MWEIRDHLIITFIKKGEGGQAKYDYWVMIGWLGDTKNMMTNAFTEGIDRKLQFTPDFVNMMTT